jgi:hypothetical protein
MKNINILLAGLIGCMVKLGSCSGVRSASLRSELQAEATPIPPLVEIKSSEGAVVSFYEADPGMLAAIATVPEGATDPIQAFLDTEGPSKNLGNLYEHLSGKSPTGKILSALNRQKKKQEQSERKSRPRPMETSAVAPEIAPDSEGDGTRSLAAVGSSSWWVEKACRSWLEYDWCYCLTSRTGGGQLVMTSDDFLQKVYPYRGVISHEIAVWKCTWFGLKCKWVRVRAVDVKEGTISTMWVSSRRGTQRFKGSVFNAEGDGYHLSWYDNIVNPGEEEVACSPYCQCNGEL